MSVIDVDELRLHLDTSLDNEGLQLLLNAEVSRLERRVGSLDGEIVETVELAKYANLVLSRPTDAVEVTDDDVEAEVTLRSDGRTVVPGVGYWTGTVVATYTPNDKDEVRAVLVDLVRLRMTETAYTSENTDSYSYENDPTTRARQREGLIRSLLPKQLPASVQLVSPIRRR